MKLVIQIPCFNEEKTLPDVLAELPRHIDGIDTIELQVIDDGSTDGTAEIAKHLGVHRIVSIAGPNQRSLGRAFQRGVDAALKAGADILVNTDGDNQYPGRFIADLVRPIVESQFDIVIGNRNPGQHREFSPVKRFLQRLGNQVISLLTGNTIPDGVSGFRAFSREALLRLAITTKHTYTLDTLVQAYAKGLSVAWVPIVVHPATRESRLIRSTFGMASHSAGNILRLFLVFAPFRAFAFVSACFFFPAVLALGRFFYYYLFVPTQAKGHIQSVVVGGTFFVIAAVLLVFGLVGELLAVNRTLLEDALTRIRRLESDRQKE